MFEKLPHIQKRHNKYGIRVRVPDELREIIGKREITKSLGTGDPAKAKPIYYEKLADVQAEIEAARMALAPKEPQLLTPDMATSFAGRYFAESIYEHEAEAHRVINNLEVNDITRSQDVSELGATLALDLQSARSGGEQTARGIADAILRANGFPEILHNTPKVQLKSGQIKPKRRRVHVDRASTGYKHLLKLAHIGQIEIYERMIAILKGETYNQQSSAFPSIALSVFTPTYQQPIFTKSASPTKTPKITISELLERFLNANPNKSDRWKLDIRTSYRVLLELKGADTDANALVKQDFRDTLAFIRRMPRQIGNKKKRWAKKSLNEIVFEIERQGGFDDDLLHPTTCNKYIRRIFQVMQWAEDEPLIERNHAGRVSIPAEEFDDDDPSREPFSMDQLNQLFRHEQFTSPDRSQPSIYWMSLISLFQGLRSEEILQLRASDFVDHADGHWVLDIHRRNGNRLKSKASIRIVPVHPELIRLGLRSLVEAANIKKDKRLFWDIERGAEGRFTPIFSRRFSRYLEKNAIKTEKTSFHSFRHNFRDAARNAFIGTANYSADEITCALGGWSYGSGAQRNYGEGIWMERKWEAIQKIEYPKLILSNIEILDWTP